MKFRKSKPENSGITLDVLKRAPQNFTAAALDFERSQVDDLKARMSLYRYVCAAGIIIGILGTATALVATLARKQPEPFVLKVDQSTGSTEVMRSIKDSEEKYDEVVNKYWLAQYIKICEGYDWYTIGEQFEACKLMSYDDVAKEYSRRIQAPESPLNLLKDKGKISIKIISIAFFGDTASVRYTSQKTNPSGEVIDGAPLQKKVATIAYEYKSGYMTDQQRLINPLGFKVASFRSDYEAQQ